MIKCAQAKRLLNRFIDEEIEEKMSKDLEMHLDSCSSCQQELERLSAVKDFVSSKERIELPEEYLIFQIRDRISRTKEIISPFQWLIDMGNLSKRLIPVPAVALALFIIFFWTIFKEYEPVNPLDTYLFQDNLSETQLNLLDESRVSLESAVKLILGNNGI